MKKWISIGVILVLIAGGSFWFYQSKKTAAPVEQEMMTTTVQKGDIKVQVSGSGSISSINSSDITSESEGIVDEVLVAVNDVVEEGDELLTFTDGSDPITAAHAGTITSLDIEDGSRVQLSQVVGHITDYKTLQTVISVDELDITSIKEGQAAKITADAFPDETFEGTVTAVSKEGTSTNGVSSFNVNVQLTDPKELLIGMSTEVTITTESKEAVLYVPIESVRVNGDEKYVIVQESNENSEATTQQVVETGINDDQNIEIVSGLTEGQLVQLAVTISSEGQGFRGGNSGQSFPGAEGGQNFPGGAQGFPNGAGGGQGFPGNTGRGNQ